MFQQTPKLSHQVLHIIAKVSSVYAILTIHEQTDMETVKSQATSLHSNLYLKATLVTKNKQKITPIFFNASFYIFAAVKINATLKYEVVSQRNYF
jgi:hypothetical protein